MPCTDIADRWEGYLRSPWEIGQSVAPLSSFPTEMQARINGLADGPTPPPQWLNLELAQIPSRAWWEWHMRRGHDPFKRRGSIAAWLRESVILRDLGVCQLCARAIGQEDDVHIDHVHPVSLGGATALGNLQLAHAACNLSKGNRI